MSISIPPPCIVVIDATRCVVHYLDGRQVETDEGFEVGGAPPWPGALPERLHPWPVPDFMPLPAAPSKE